MIKHQFSDRSRFVIKATMKDRYKKAAKVFKNEIKGGLWATKTPMRRNSKGKLVPRVLQKVR